MATPGDYCLYHQQYFQTSAGLANAVRVTQEGKAILANIQDLGFTRTGIISYTNTRKFTPLVDPEGCFIPAPQGWDNFKPGRWNLPPLNF